MKFGPTRLPERSSTPPAAAPARRWFQIYLFTGLLMLGLSGGALYLVFHAQPAEGRWKIAKVVRGRPYIVSVDHLQFGWPWSWARGDEKDGLTSLDMPGYKPWPLALDAILLLFGIYVAGALLETWLERRYGPAAGTRLQFHLSTLIIFVLLAGVLIGLNMPSPQEVTAKLPPNVLPAGSTIFVPEVGDCEMPLTAENDLPVKYALIGWPCRFGSVTERLSGEVQLRLPIGGDTPLAGGWHFAAADALSALWILFCVSVLWEVWLARHPPPADLSGVRRRLEMGEEGEEREGSASPNPQSAGGTDKRGALIRAREARFNGDGNPSPNRIRAFS